ncbi:hypothetical protein JCM13991_14770 [Thermodesulfovibrio hydrogeniphilus]
MSSYVRFMDIAREFISEAILSFYGIALPACRQARNDPFLRHCEGTLAPEAISFFEITVKNIYFQKFLNFYRHFSI